jgi:PAS domain S-box-containing protein
VLIDFNLPGTDGLQFVQTLVSAQGANAFGIVMLTSASEIAVAVKALHIGAHDYLEKNAADGIALRRVVDNAVEKAAIQSELEAKRATLIAQNEELARHIGRLEQEAAERVRAQAALRQSESQLRLVTDHASVLLIQVDQNHRYKFVNRGYAERYGVTVEEATGSHVASVVGERAYLSALGEIQAALNGERVEFEKEIPYPALGLRWIHAVFMPERDPEGRVVGFVGVLTDLTERKQTEQDLKQARDEALAASRAKDEFLAKLSHELRTPLSPVLLLASEAAANPDLPPEVRADFHTIRKNVDLEARLIDDLLDITRISRGKLSLEMRRVDLHAVLWDASVSVRGEALAKRIHLEMCLDASEHAVNGDAVRLQQVFWNLLNNAIKFTPEHGHIRVNTCTLGEHLRIEVEDNGRGLTPEEMAGIFEAFSQGDHALPTSTHQFGGLGLGLAISRMLVELHHGSIHARSAGRGQGAVFEIRIPLSMGPPSGPEPEGISSPYRESDALPKVPPLRVLLVEDHEPTRTALAFLLTRRGHHVTQAGSMAGALELVDSQGFELLVSDIGLPDGSGYHLMEAIQAGHSIPGIALTGYGMDHDLARSRQAGFLGHLTKPVRIQELEAEIARIMNRLP